MTGFQVAPVHSMAVFDATSRHLSRLPFQIYSPDGEIYPFSVYCAAQPIFRTRLLSVNSASVVLLPSRGRNLRVPVTVGMLVNLYSCRCAGVLSTNIVLRVRTPVWLSEWLSCHDLKINHPQPGIFTPVMDVNSEQSELSADIGFYHHSETCIVGNVIE